VAPVSEEEEEDESEDDGGEQQTFVCYKFLAFGH
jgi:hypothetical protein